MFRTFSRLLPLLLAGTLLGASGSKPRATRPAPDPCRTEEPALAAARAAHDWQRLLTLTENLENRLPDRRDSRIPVCYRTMALARLQPEKALDLLQESRGMKARMVAYTLANEQGLRPELYAAAERFWKGERHGARPRGQIRAGQGPF